MNNYRVTFIGQWKMFTTVYPNKIKQVKYMILSTTK